MDAQRQNNLAKQLRSLCKPGDPLVLTNVYDAATASVVANHSSTKAVATASFAFAAINGVDDNDLTLVDNLAGIRSVSSALAKAELPLTADMQDGYEDVAASIKQCIEAGAVGCNIEDVNNKTGELRSVDNAVSRLQTALEAAAEAGVPDFCLNARTDVLAYRGSVADAIKRGKAFLAAGAVTVYVWGGPQGRGVSKDELKESVDGLSGFINVRMKLMPGYLNANELKELGVARISVGPDMWVKAMAGFKDALEVVARGERFE